MTGARLYRPSSGAEGEWFTSRFCDRCVKDTKAKPCWILGRTMIYHTRDKEYPRQWIEDEAGPRCTAFADHVPAPLSIIRDTRQAEMML